MIQTNTISQKDGRRIGSGKGGAIRLRLNLRIVFLAVNCYLYFYLILIGLDGLNRTIRIII